MSERPDKYTVRSTRFAEERDFIENGDNGDDIRLKDFQNGLAVLDIDGTPICLCYNDYTAHYIVNILNKAPIISQAAKIVEALCKMTDQENISLDEIAEFLREYKKDGA